MKNSTSFKLLLVMILFVLCANLIFAETKKAKVELTGKERVEVDSLKNNILEFDLTIQFPDSVDSIDPFIIQITADDKTMDNKFINVFWC